MPERGSALGGAVDADAQVDAVWWLAGERLAGSSRSWLATVAGSVQASTGRPACAAAVTAARVAASPAGKMPRPPASPTVMSGVMPRGRRRYSRYMRC